MRYWLKCLRCFALFIAKSTERCVRLLWNNFRAEKVAQREQEIYVWCLSIMFAAAITSRFEYRFIVLSTFVVWSDKEKRTTGKTATARRFKISAGSVMSDKSKGTFVSLPLSCLRRVLVRTNNAVLCAYCLCLLFVVSDIFDDRLNSHIAFKLCFTFLLFGLLLALTFYNET